MSDCIAMISGVSRREAGRWTLAHALAKGEEYLFDYLFYPFMLYEGGRAAGSFIAHQDVGASTGFWVGFAVLVAISTALNVAYLRMYDRTRTDWFGFERLRNIEGRTWMKSRVLARGFRFGVFGYLSIWHSPLFATLWTRSRSVQYQMQDTDWVAFSVSVLLANIGWTGFITAAVWLVGTIQRTALG